MRSAPVVLAFALAVHGLAQAPTITWEPDLAAAQAAQQKDGKPVLAYFTFET